MRGRIVLSEDSPIAYRVYQQSVCINSTGELESNGAVFHGIIESSKEPVEGHFGIFVVKKGVYASPNMIGIAHEKQELPDKSYVCAKKYAEEVAEACSCVLVDNTSRGNEEYNLMQEEKLRSGLLERRRDAEKNHQETLRSLREKGLDKVPYCISGADIGD